MWILQLAVRTITSVILVFFSTSACLGTQGLQRVLAGTTFFPGSLDTLLAPAFCRRELSELSFPPPEFFLIFWIFILYFIFYISLSNLLHSQTLLKYPKELHWCLKVLVCSQARDKLWNHLDSWGGIWVLQNWPKQDLGLPGYAHHLLEKKRVVQGPWASPLPPKIKSEFKLSILLKNSTEKTPHSPLWEGEGMLVKNGMSSVVQRAVVQSSISFVINVWLGLSNHRFFHNSAHLKAVAN